MGRQIFFAIFCVFFAGAFCQLPSIRFFHAAPGAHDAVKVTFGNVELGSNIAPGAATDYVSTTAANAELVVDLGDGTSIKANVTLAEKDKLTVAAVANGSLSLLVLSDSTAAPSSYSAANLRFANLIFNTSAALQVAGGPNFNTQIFSTHSSYVSYGGTRSYGTTLVSGEAKLDVNVTLVAGEVYTAYAIGTAEALQLVVLVDGNYRRSYLRFGHFSPDTGGIDIYLGTDTAPTFTNVSYTQTTGYIQLKDKDVVVKIRATGKDTTILLQQTIEAVEPGSILAFFFAGLTGNTQGVVLSEPIVDTTKTASVRIINLSPDSRTVTVTLGPVTDSLKFSNISTPYSFEAGNYSLKIESTNKDRRRRVWVRVNGEFVEQTPLVEGSLLLQTTTYLLVVQGRAADVTYQLNQVPSTNPPSSPLPNEPEQHGLTTIAVVSIIVGSLLGAILAVGLAIYCFKSKRQYQTIP